MNEPPLRTLSPDNFRRIREVFEAALGRPPAERLPFAERQCASEPHILGEVKRMLAADGQTHAIVDPPLRAAGQGARPSSCASCGSTLTALQKFCPECGTPVGGDREGRFRAGALFASRFRIVAALGRGGMGEVYRAHDLELGQPVALKFLSALRSDEQARQRLRNEVRLARQLAHANVCRVYDIGEAHGELYLSMEYVDGEDLAALLKRIGRVPVDKGIEIARKLCAGLAAAHAKGVLHRDLKPANIMIDGSGEVRIMDFGIAAVASELDEKDVRSGTPAYMAPEQLAGRESTAQSDLYALGLVLYELFTGKVPFEGRDPGDLQRQRESHPSTTPATLIPDLGPRVERTILRCLEPDPKLRPASALEVSASLPGGDPLAEALAAGETPSPELVAASGPTHALAPRVAIALTVTAFAGIAAMAVLTPRTLTLEGLHLDYPPAALTQRARDALAALGLRDRPPYVIERFDVGVPPNRVIFRYQESAARPPGRPADLDRFVRPPSLPEARLVDVALDGRLLALHVPSSIAVGAPPVSGVDWIPLFRAAGLDFLQFQEENSDQSLTDGRTTVGWVGVSGPGASVRVRATVLSGRALDFEVIHPPSARVNPQPVLLGPLQQRPWPLNLLLLLMLATIAVIAWANCRTGRADIRGAWRLWLYGASLLIVIMLLQAPDLESVVTPDFLFTAFTFGGAIGALYYLALEPLVRRIWPSALVTWSRVLAGRWRDPVVATDVLIVLACVGLRYAVVRGTHVAGIETGLAVPLDPVTMFSQDFGFSLDNLVGGRATWAGIVWPFFRGLGALQFFALLFLFKWLLRRTWLAALAWVVFFGLFTITPHLLVFNWIGVLQWVLELGVLSALIVRRGLFAGMAWAPLSLLADLAIYTSNVSAWYGQSSLIAMAILFGVGLWAFRTSLGDRSLLPASWTSREAL